MTSEKKQIPANVQAQPDSPTTGSGQPVTPSTPATAQTSQEATGYSTSENTAYDMGSGKADSQKDAVNNINQENREGMHESAEHERKAEKNAGGPSPNVGNKPGGTSM